MFFIFGIASRFPHKRELHIDLVSREYVGDLIYKEENREANSVGEALPLALGSGGEINGG